MKKIDYYILREFLSSFLVISLFFTLISLIVDVFENLNRFIDNSVSFEILLKYAELIGHVHASEPNLVPLGDGTTNHKIFFKALTRPLP